MSYTPITWTDKSTLMEAEHMNAMEQALKDHDDAIEQLSNFLSENISQIEKNTENISQNTNDIAELRNSLAENTEHKAKVFDNTRSLLDQIDELEYQTFTFGYILSSGNQSTCEVPANQNFYVISTNYSASSASVFLWQIGSASRVWIGTKSSGAWNDWLSLYFTS